MNKIIYDAAASERAGYPCGTITYDKESLNEIKKLFGMEEHMYVLETWDYSEDKEAKEKFIKHFNNIQKTTVIIDREKNDSFVLLGDGRNTELDKQQGKALLKFINSDEFPKE